MESKRTRVLQPWLVAAALMVMLGFGFGAANVAAQDGSTPASLPDTGMAVQASPEAGDDSVSALPETGVVIQASPEAVDDSVSALPETGSGSDSTSTGVLVTALALATSVLGLGALATRKMLVRR
jgi:hypothetical protein